MTHDWITTLLALGFFAATAAFFVMWSKYEEQKQKTAEDHTAYRNALEYGNAIAEALKEERNRRWDEISRAVGLENELERSKAQEKCSAEALLWYADHLAGARVIHENLQDRLSALLCPTNNHIWKDGVCVKCGRVKDD